MRSAKIIFIVFLSCLTIRSSAQNRMNDQLKQDDSTTSELKIHLPDHLLTLNAYVHPIQAGLSIRGYQYSLQLSNYVTPLVIQHNMPGSYYKQVQLPIYTQGAFCDFEDHINRHRKLRIDFSVK